MPPLPASTHPGPVRLQVASLARSLEFYRGVLGLRLLDGATTGDEGRARLGAHGEDKLLVELVERPGARAVPRGGRPGLYHFALLLPDRADLGTFVAHLAEARVPAGSADHLVSEALYLQDPDGLGIEVYADRPRSTWQVRGGELAMATDPLDLADLVEAARGRPWQGMPPGTTMGHLHLHVGDLHKAEAFYGEALGLEVTVRRYPGALFLSAGGYHHHLGLNTWAAHAEAAGEGDARLLEWSLVVGSEAAVVAASQRLESGGFAVQQMEAGGALARDPWGTALRLVTAA